MKTLSFLLLAATAFAANAADPVPPITTTASGAWDPGQLVWADLLTDDVARARKFYGDVFGWQFTGDDQYAQATNAGVPVAGIAFHEPRDPQVSEVAWLVSISVEDVDAAATAVPGAGGTVLEAPRTVADRGRFAIVEDAQGAVVVLLRSSQGDPPDRRSVDNEWIWGELWTRDRDQASRFYGKSIGYDSRTVTEADGTGYTVLLRDGKPKTGIVELPWDSVPPNWLPYLRVADVAATIERIEAAGGYVLLQSRDESDKGIVAVVSDSTGGAFAIQSPRKAR